MITSLLIGVVTMSVCLLMQSIVLVKALRYYAVRDARTADASAWAAVRAINVVMLLLVAGNLVQLAIWAGIFMLLGEFDSFGTAVYHSAVNFATLGYGDIVLSERHRLLGPLEAINGVLMIGVSTAALMSVFQHAIRRSAQSRNKKAGS